MFGMNGFHVSASGAIQGHHGPLVVLVRGLIPIPKYCNVWYEGISSISQWSDTGPSWLSCFFSDNVLCFSADLFVFVMLSISIKMISNTFFDIPF